MWSRSRGRRRYPQEGLVSCVSRSVSLALRDGRALFFTPMMSVSLLMKPAMQQQNLLDDMRELNLSYLMLAQRMLREDYPVGLFRLGLSADVADALLKLSPPQLLRLSNLNMALGRLRLDSPEVVAALSGKDVMGGALQRARMAIMMAGQPVERIA